MHRATSQFGLTAGDIRSMSFGDQIKVLLMDRNVGDYTSGYGPRNFDPREEGFSYATYVHAKDLTGMLNFHDIGVQHVPFVWEVNLAALGDKAS